MDRGIMNNREYAQRHLTGTDYVGVGASLPKQTEQPPRQEIMSELDDLHALLASLEEEVASLATTLKPVSEEPDDKASIRHERPWCMTSTAVSRSVQEASRRVYFLREAICGIHARVRI